MLFFVSLFFTLVIMLIGLLINDSWYKKHNNKLSEYIIDGFVDEDLIIITVFIGISIIIFLAPGFNILAALSLNIGLFIKGGGV